MIGWVFLAIAILAEIAATTSLRYSNGFTNLVPSIVTVLGYMLAFGMLSQSLRTSTSASPMRCRLVSARQ